jgi:hypothetical protein
MGHGAGDREDASLQADLIINIEVTKTIKSLLDIMLRAFFRLLVSLVFHGDTSAEKALREEGLLVIRIHCLSSGAKFYMVKIKNNDKKNCYRL